MDGWNHNNCNSDLWACCIYFQIFSDCIFVPLLLSLSCQTLLCCLRIFVDRALWTSTLFSQTNIYLLVTAVLSLALVSSVIISASISLSFSPMYGLLLQLSIYLFIVTLYSCQSKSAIHSSAFSIICLSNLAELYWHYGLIILCV